jgi:hypothetical protein
MASKQLVFGVALGAAVVGPAVLAAGAVGCYKLASWDRAARRLMLESLPETLAPVNVERLSMEELELAIAISAEPLVHFGRCDSADEATRLSVRLALGREARKTPGYNELIAERKRMVIGAAYSLVLRGGRTEVESALEHASDAVILSSELASGASAFQMCLNSAKRAFGFHVPTPAPLK